MNNDNKALVNHLDNLSGGLFETENGFEKPPDTVGKDLRRIVYYARRNTIQITLRKAFGKR